MNSNSILDESRSFINLFFRNVDYLRRKRNLQVKEVVKGIEATTGRKISRHSIRLYRDEMTSAHIRYLLNYCRFFGVSLPEMLGTDLQAQDELKGL